MNRKIILFVLVSLFTSVAFPLRNLYAQSKHPAEIAFGGDIVSRYIWRGKDYGNSPAIQPNFSVGVAGFKAGVWGSYGLSSYSQKINDTTFKDMGHYAECDLSVSYTYKWFTLMVTDYFFPNGLTPNDNNKYFNYDSQTTGHAIEGCLTFNGPEKFPIQVMACTFLYGADKGKDSTGTYGLGTKNNYSTYFEVSYPFKIHNIIDLKPFAAGIPFGSAIYGHSAGIVNLGMTASKSIPIVKDKYAITLYTSLITNPQAQSIFLVFGVTL
jgi:hypothetical protein